MSETQPDSQKQENDHLNELKLVCQYTKFHLAPASDILTQQLTSVHSESWTECLDANKIQRVQSNKVNIKKKLPS